MLIVNINPITNMHIFTFTDIAAATMDMAMFTDILRMGRGIAENFMCKLYLYLNTLHPHVFLLIKK